jgi:hypothetical protein
MSGDAPAGDLLRALVREVLGELVRESMPAGGPPPVPAPGALPDPAQAVVPRARGGYAPQSVAAPHPVVAVQPVTADHSVALERSRPARGRVEEVVLRHDADLQAFAQRLLGLYENPVARREIKNGQVRFRLAGAAPEHASAAAVTVQRIERGAVTERHVTGAAAAGSRLVLGRSAVLTPLAREKARALGVHVEKER